jgi:hypothetical protein
VVRYSWVAGSLPSEKNSNLPFSGVSLCSGAFGGLPSVRFWDALSRQRAILRPRTRGITARTAGSLLLFLVEISASC